MEEKESIYSLYEDVLYSYDDNIRAITLHMSYISTNSKKIEASSSKNKKEPFDLELDLKIAKFKFSKIKTNKDLSTKAGLEKYRMFFERILDTSKSDINKFVKLAEFDLSGESDKYHNLEYYSRNLSNIEVHFPKLHKELTTILYNVEKILDNISGGHNEE